MCCKTAGGFNDVCTNDGLCSRPHNPTLGEDQGVLRSTCTDPSWESPSCVQLCTTGFDLLGKPANASEQYVQQCGDGSWCCETSKHLNSTQQAKVNACCDQGKGMFVVNGKVTSVNPSGTSSISGASATAKASPSSTRASATPATSSSAAPTPHNNNAGAIAGGVIGGIAVSVTIVVAVFFFFRRRSKKSKAQEQEPAISDQKDALMHLGGPMHETEAGQRPHEKLGSERFEKDGTQLTGERGGPYEI
jgi:hypothetical protein